jgi:hypothetical protein
MVTGPPWTEPGYGPRLVDQVYISVITKTIQNSKEISRSTAPELHKNYNPVPGLNKKQISAFIFYLDPWTLSKLHFGPYLFIHKPFQYYVFPNIPLNLSKFQFCHPNFFPPYLSNRNSELGNSCTKILRITSSFSSSYSYSYD